MERLNAAAPRALQDPRIRERLAEDGQFVQGGTPEEFAAFLRGEAEQWRPILCRLEVSQNRAR